MSDKTAASEDVEISSDSQLAFDRTLMAEERTCSAWVRTGLASMATGLAIAKVMPGAHPRWAVSCLGISLVIVAAMSFAIGFIGYVRSSRHYRWAGRGAMSWWVIAIFAQLLATAAVLSAVFILQDDI